MARPEVGDDDVLVEIHAAGINLFDAKIADGEFKILRPYRFPLVLGNDVAGIVVGTMVSNSCGGQRIAQGRIRILENTKFEKLQSHRRCRDAAKIDKKRRSTLTRVRCVGEGC